MERKEFNLCQSGFRISCKWMFCFSFVLVHLPLMEGKSQTCLTTPLPKIQFDVSTRTCSAPDAAITFSLEGENVISSRYKWEVSESPSGPWTNIYGINRPSTVTATPSQLFKTGFASKYGGTRYIRVSEPSCSGRAAYITVENLYLLIPAPRFNATGRWPSCHYFAEDDNATGKDGSVEIRMIAHENPDGRYLLNFHYTAVTSGISDPNFAGQVEKDFNENPAITVAYTADDLKVSKPTTKAFRPGTYYVVMSNIDDGKSCSTTEMFSIGNPAQLAVHRIAGHHLNCYESTTEGSYIGLSVNYGLETTSKPPFTYELQTVVSQTDETITTRRAITPTGSSNPVKFNSYPDFKEIFTKGSYRIKVTNSVGCSGYAEDGSDIDDDEHVIEIIRPNLMTMDVELPSSINGYRIACKGGDVNIKVTATGGGFGNSSTNDDFEASIYKGTVLTEGADEMFGNGQIGAWRNFSNQKAGSYTAYVTDLYGCTKSKSFILNEPPSLPTATVKLNLRSNGYNLLCPEHTDASGEITASGGTPPYTYRWTKFPASVHSNNAIVTDLWAGKFVGGVTDGNGCVAAELITVTAPPAMVLETSVTSNYGTAANPRDVSCVGVADGKAKVEVTANTDPPYLYDWSTGDIGKEATDLSAGQLYSVTVRSKTGCEVSSNITLTVPPSIAASPFVSSDYNGSDISCFGEEDGELDVTVTNGAGEIAYLWGKDGSPGITHSEKIFSSIGPGKYWITATDVNDCEAKASIVVVTPPLMSASIASLSDYNGQLISCAGQNDAMLKANALGGTGSYSYLWSNNSSDQVASELAQGNYSVTVSDLNGCIATDDFTITDPPPLETEIIPTSNYHGQLISCTGESDAAFSVNALGGTGDYSYLWNDNTTASARSGQSAGDYSVYVSDENGCLDTAKISVPDPDPVLLNLLSISDFNGYGISCHGETDGKIEVTAEGGTGIFSYQWTEGPAANIWNNLGAGSYSVTAQDQNGCAVSENYLLTEADALELSVASTQDVTCFDGSNGSVILSASGGTGGIYYSHDNNTWQPDHTFTGLPADFYSFSATDQNECLANTAAIIMEPEKIEIDFSDITPAYCAEARGSARAEVSGGTGDLELEWTDGSGMIISTNDLISEVYAGAYTLTVTDANSCAVESSVGISSIDGPTVLVRELQNTLCHNSSDGRASLEVEGNGPFTIRWPDGQSTEEVTNLQKGIYIVKISDINDCETVQNVEISSPSPVTVNLRSLANVSCFGDCNGSIDIEVSGGNGDYQYDWSNNETLPLLSNLCTGTYDVVVTDKNNCSASESFAITTPSALSVSLQSSSPESCFEKCDGKLKVLAKGGASGYTYVWSNSSRGAELNDLCKSNYTVTVTDAHECVVTGSYTITGPDVLSITGTSATLPTCMDGCDGSLAVVASGGNGGYAYQWVNGSSGLQNNNLCSGSYSVTATDKLGCTAHAEFTLENQLPVTVDMEDEITLCEGQIYKLDAGNFATYQWTSSNGFTASTRIVEISEDGLYKVEVTTAKGCTGDAEFLLQTSQDLLEAQFITVHEAFEGDTLVLIDVTWPVADNVEWEIPEAMEVIGLKNGDLMGRFDSKGTYSVGMHAYLGLCYDYVEKTIEILEEQESKSEGGRLGFQEELLDFTLAPNPTTGNFNVHIELAEAREISLSVINGVTGKILARVSDAGESSYSVPFNLAPLGGGVYVLRLDLVSGTHYIRFIVK